MSNAKDKQPNPGSMSALARHLGLSRWTVSRVLNGHPGISPKTVAKVQKAIHELGFQPNPLARGLRGGSTATIGICFQELESPILVKKIGVLQHQLRDRGYRAIIELTNGNIDLERQTLQHFFSVRVDGIVLIGTTQTSDSPLIQQLVNSQTPVILVDPERDIPLPTITLDRYQGIQLVMDHLYEQGHRRFATLGIDGQVPYGNSRWEGIRAWLKKKKLKLSDSIVAVSDDSDASGRYEDGQRLAERLMKQVDVPRALVCINDRVAIGAIRVLHEHGYSVPGEFSVVGFDNLDVSEFTHPPLTTVTQQVDEMMTQATSLLFDQIEGKMEVGPFVATVEPQLIPRGSTLDK